jgi:two-component system, chemotaxis family, protein-glutamate methylesterase/glutaminase
MYEVIVIGTSWGGLDALSRLLDGLHDDVEQPMVVVQHRSVESEGSALAEVLAHHTTRTVCDPDDKTELEPFHVYLAPPDYHVLVEHGHVALSTDAVVQFARPSIDVLFDSAADIYADRLAAVILTGANDDGAYGIARVRRRGGVTIAQDPAGAERPQMPTAAIATGAVQHVLPLEEIGPFLGKIAGGERNAA